MENPHKVRNSNKTFVFYYVAVICTTTGWQNRKIRAWVDRYDQSTWTAKIDEDRNDAHIASTVVRLY